MAEPDSWDDEDDDEDFHEPEPEDFADPSCIVCGGQGGFCSEIKNGQCVWTKCDCIDWAEYRDALR